MVTSRDILRGTFRLSIVVALSVAAYNGYQQWVASNERYEEDQAMVRTLECGAAVPQERLMPARNEYGNIDLGKVGCARTEFWASFAELQKARDGTIRQQMEGFTINKYQIAETAVYGFAAFVAVNLLGFAFLGARAVFFWVAKRFKPRT